jgi:phosphoglycolate phosphatase
MAIALLRGQPIGAIDGVLFDKDGTLSNSEPKLIRLAEQRIEVGLKLWKERGFAPSSNLDPQQLLRQVFGVRDGGLDPAGTLAVAARQDNLTSMASVFCLLGCSWPEAHTIAAHSFDIVDQRAGEAADVDDLLPEADVILSQLRRSGLHLAVISNDTTSGIHCFLRGHGLEHLFQAIWSAEDSPRKPDPQAARALCRQLNLEPARCALIGDAETDLQMASAAGLGLVLGFNGGWRFTPELPSAEHCFNRWSDLSVATSS